MSRVLRLDPWLPPLALMGLIFFLSAQPDLSTNLGTIDRIGRKFVHAGVYAALCFLWWRALRTVMPAGRALAAAMAVTLAYAASDEYHQGFVRGRHASVADVAIDAAGALAAALAVRWRA